MECLLTGSEALIPFCIQMLVSVISVAGDVEGCGLFAFWDRFVSVTWNEYAKLLSLLGRLGKSSSVDEVVVNETLFTCSFVFFN